MNQTTRPVGAAGGTGVYEPLRLCIYTTIALIAWAVGPPLAVAMFAGLGLVGYVRAHRAGLQRTRCWLGDSRLVITYLGVAFTLGATSAVQGLVHFIT
jgi:hypothetical protein